MDVLKRVIVFVLVATATTAGVTALLIAATRPALAVQNTPPPYSHSWYVRNVNAADLYAWAQAVDGPFDNSTCTNSLIVLNFGQPANVNGAYGTYYFAPGYPFVDVLTIIYDLENYAHGWYRGTGSCPRLHLVAGTNNYNQLPTGSGTVSTAGSTWANVARAVQDYLATNGYSWQITSWAGDDMEQPSGGQAWDCASRTRQFVDGFNGNPNATVFLDYGTALVPNTCWTASDVWYVAYGAVHDWPLPEIYTEAAMVSWVNVRLSYFMVFKGVMTECQQNDPLPSNYCTTPAGQYAPTLAWGALFWNLASNGVGQSSLDYATNIR